LINLIINNKPISVKPGTTVLQACEAANEEIPRFCYHDKLSVAGNCRMCLVEIEKSPKPVVSCAMPVMEGMRVYTNTPLAKKASETVLEYLLINHPLDCPICDQGGECDLQDQTLAYGSDRGRFFEFKRGVEDKECGPIIKTIMTRCIHCTRCVRFTEEISGTEELGVISRGTHAEIGTYVNKFIKTELSGNLVDLCPVGALTSKPYAFSARNWELKKTESIDFLDAVCSNILINTRNSSITQKTDNIYHQKDEIIRILPRANDDINEDWISDKTRYAFDGLRKQRLTEPAIFVKNIKTQVTWTDMLNYFDYYASPNIKKNFIYKNHQKITALYGNLSDMESLYFLFQFLNELGSNNIQYSNNLFRLNVDIPLFYKFNSTIKNIEQSDLILLIGVNPRFEASMVNVRIRKQYMRYNIPVALVGNAVDLTYPHLHLGTSTKTLIQIAEGKHLFCKDLRAAKNPLVICGTEFLQRRDSEALINVTRFLAQNIFAHLENENNYNILASSVGFINGCELAIQPGIRSKLHLLNNKRQFIDLLYLMNLDHFNNNKWIDFESKNIRTKVFVQDSHITNSLKSADFIIPTKTPYEKTSLFSNIEGRIQKSYQSTSSYENARNTMTFFQAVAKTLDLCENQGNHNFTKSILFKENPYLKNLNKLGKNFNINFLKYREAKNKIYLSNFLPLINNFYMTDSISNNSTVMSECSLFLKDTRFNYKKKYIN
jgi:NADH-quinone oxidoreductase chain G